MFGRPAVALAKQKLSIASRYNIFPTIMENIQKNLTSRKNKSKGHLKPIDLNSTQTSDLRLQSSNLSADYFEQVCAELLREGHGIKFRAPGDSMYPTICDGDLITVEPIKPSDVILGDIVLYSHEYGVVAHRVINIKKTQPSIVSPQHYFTLRGDAAPKDDDPVISIRF